MPYVKNKTFKNAILFLVAVFLCLTINPHAYASEKLGIHYAKKFSIDYMDNGVKVVTDSMNKKTILLPKGIKMPDNLKKIRNVQVVRTPVDKVFVGSTTHVAFLKKLKPVDKIYDTVVAVTTKESIWRNPEIIKRMKNGQITYVQKSYNNALNTEKVIELMPNVVFASGMDVSEGKELAQLETANIAYVTPHGYMEESDEAYLEWLKFFAAFYNLDEEADKIFEETIAYMNKLKLKVKTHIEKEKISRPTVITGSIFKGVVWTQGGDCKFTRNVHNAGGINVLSDAKVNGSLRMNMENFFDKCKEADIFIYSSSSEYMPSLKALLETNPLFAEFKAVKNNNVYVYDRGYYMNAGEVKEKFEDFIYILQPSLMPGHKLKHYEKLGTK